MTIVCNGCPSQVSRSNPSGSHPLPCDMNIAEEVNVSGRDLRLIPDQIRKSTNLKILDLSNNSLGQGTYDETDDWTGLRTLTRLNLSTNELREISVNLENFPLLEVLCLTGNELEKLPEEIVNLRRLKRLHADFNYLHDLPRDWSSLCSLTKLTLSNNRLQEIPSTIWTLQSLRVLNLQKNSIETILPIPDNAATHLEELRLGRNQLSESLDISNFVNLSVLDVSYNELEYLDLTKLYNLESLTVCHNNLKELKLDGAKLKHLSAGDNDLEDIECRQSTFYLETLDVSHNNLSALPEWIAKSKLLTDVSAEHNQIIFLPKEIFECAGLRTLRVNHNLLEYIPELPPRCSLSSLYLQYNKIERLPDNFFTSLLSLEVVNLSYNSLQCIPHSSCSTHLKTVLLSGNNIKDIKNVVDLLRGSCVDTLHIACNAIKDLPASFFGSLPLLKVLSLSGNELQNVSSHFSKARSLKKLYLHSNKISTIPSLNGCENLQVLDLACNDLHQLELASSVPPSLSYLDLSSNCDLLIDPKDFQHLCRERSVAVVDVNCAGRQAPLRDAVVKHAEILETSPWLLGFTESQDGNTRLYIELQTDSTSGQQEALIALMELEDANEVAHLRNALPELLKMERECKETYQHYLKNALLSSVRFLIARGYTKSFGITMCHLSSTPGGPVTLRFASVGVPSSCVLGRAGGIIVLAHRLEATPVEMDEWDAALKEAEVCRTNHFNISSSKRPPRGSWGAIPDPKVRELTLSHQDKFLVFGDNAFSRTVPAEEVCRQVQIAPTPVSAAKALAEFYSALTNGKRECVAVIMFKSSAVVSEEEVEKYRCWEFMLEQNHKLLFTKELETIHKNILRNGSHSVTNGDPTSWYTSALSKYKCPLPSHRGRYYCYGNNKTE